MKFETGRIHYRDLGSEDGDGNDKVKKPIGFIRKTTTASHASRIFVNFFVVTARLRSENSQFHFSLDDVKSRRNFFPGFCELGYRSK